MLRLFLIFLKSQRIFLKTVSEMVLWTNFQKVLSSWEHVSDTAVYHNLSSTTQKKKEKENHHKIDFYFSSHLWWFHTFKCRTAILKVPERFTGKKYFLLTLCKLELIQIITYYLVLCLFSLLNIIIFGNQMKQAIRNTEIFKSFYWICWGKLVWTKEKFLFINIMMSNKIR